MPEPHHAEDAGPSTSSTAALAGPPASPVARHRSRAMKIITPLVLFGLGVVLLVLAVVLYPSAAAEVPGPYVPTWTINSNVPISAIAYTVTRVSSGRTRIGIRVWRVQVGQKLRWRASVDLPLGAGHPPGREEIFPHSRAFTETVHFTVNVADFGMSFNGITASVAIPKIGYTGPGTPYVTVDYPIPSASTYDWSSLSPTTLDPNEAIWTTSVAKIGEEGLQPPGQVAVGINHARQTTDSNKTFAAGALLGLAGGAILSAVQEALHARD
jgi:hypothetical protein